jgi:aspartate-semialdehyde dehydrogenase
MNQKIKVAVLGATGSVGQKFVELLIDHPWFELHEVAASERSAGKLYKEATNWIMSEALPERIANLEVKECEPNLESKIVFSGMDASVAGEIETNFANEGYFVISNARNHRYDKDVPLLIPEVNHDHLQLVKTQTYKGGIVTNPNCSTIGLVLALKPLIRCSLV